MANNIDLTICALECPLGTFQCSGRLFFRKEYTVLFSEKRTTSRFASLTLRTPHRPIVSLCFSPKRTTSRFALLSLRTPHRSPVSSPLAAAAALWLPCVRGAVRRRAGLRGYLRVRGKGKGRRPSPVSAPNRLFELHWCFARLIRQAETLRLQPHSRPPSEHTVLFLPKRSCFRFASLTLRTAHRNLLSEGSGVPHGLFCDSAPSPIRALVFRSAYSASRNARPPAASRPPNPAPSSRLFSISRRSGLRGCRHRAESTPHLTPSGCVPSGGAVAPPAPPLPPPSRCRPDRFKGSP